MKSRTETGSQKIQNLKQDVESGRIRIPRFQREYVWKVPNAAKLVDSVLKGYPIGSLIYWNSNEELRDVRNLGNLAFPDPESGEKINYVLDGQQRLTSLLCALNGLKVEIDEGVLLDFTTILVDLNDYDHDEPIVFCSTELNPSDNSIPLKDLYLKKGAEYKRYRDSHEDKINAYSEQLIGYDIPKVTLYDADIEKATDVFSRLNTEGKALSVFEIMVAKTYSPKRGFDLIEKWQEIYDEIDSKNFGTVRDLDLLQLTSLIIKAECGKSAILSISRDDFINAWPESVLALKEGIDFIKASVRVPVSRLLPYGSILILVSMFFKYNKFKKPNAKQKKKLIDLFWRAGWHERYNASADTKLEQDLDIVKSIVSGKEYGIDWSGELDWRELADATFSTGAAFSKTILSFLASQKPKSLANGDDIFLDNSYLQQSNSRNYHHIFPKKFLKDSGYENMGEINRVVNICLVDDYLNKTVIRARAPSDYLSSFRDENGDFQNSMESHLLKGDKITTAWETDNYDNFVELRSRAITKAISRVMIE